MAHPCVVVVGSGSAGRRHTAAVRRSLPDARILVVRRGDSTQPLAPLVAVGAELVPTLDDALKHRPAIAIVASPAPHHCEASRRLLAAGADVLVEKPLAQDVDAAESIVQTADRLGRRLVVGYHLRYGETVPRLKRLVQQGAIGAPTGFQLTVGQHLDQWRPGMDPRQSVSARRELGGGVLLELSHELDGLRYLLGEAVGVSAELAYDGAPTDGAVETVADLVVHLRSGIEGDIHLDMVSPVPSRRWVVQGSTGHLTADLLSGTIVHEDGPGSARLIATNLPGERDRSEHRLIENLIASAAGEDKPRCTGADGVAAVALVAAARDSVRSGDVIRVGESSPPPT